MTFLIIIIVFSYTTEVLVSDAVYYGVSDAVYYGASDVMYYGVDYNPREVLYGLNPSVSDVINYSVDNPEVFATLEEFDIPDIDVTDVPPNVVYPEMILKFHFYVMSSIMWFCHEILSWILLVAY